MTAWQRFIVFSLIAVLFVGAGWCVHLAYSFASGKHGFGTSVRSLFAEARRDDEITPQIDRVHDRLQVKHKIIEQLIAGQMSLRQAVERFRDLDEAHIPDAFRQMPRDERLARSILAGVKIRLRHQRSLAETVLPRLERELAEFLEANKGAQVHNSLRMNRGTAFRAGIREGVLSTG